ncbi:MAG: hypothetical protein AAF725_05065 [Acidobacteriota bacterium]
MLSRGPSQRLFNTFFSAFLGCALGAGPAAASPCGPAIHLDALALAERPARGAVGERAQLVIETRSPGVLLLEWDTSGGADSPPSLGLGACAPRGAVRPIEQGARRLSLAILAAGTHGFALERAGRGAIEAEARFVPGLILERSYGVGRGAPSGGGHALWVEEVAIFSSEADEPRAPALLEGPGGWGPPLASVFTIRRAPEDGRAFASAGLVTRSREAGTAAGARLDSALRLSVWHTAAETDRGFPEVDPDPDGLAAPCRDLTREFPEVDPDPDGLAAAAPGCRSELSARLLSEADSGLPPGEIERSLLEWAGALLWPEPMGGGGEAPGASPGFRLHSFR